MHWSSVFTCVKIRVCSQRGTTVRFFDSSKWHLGYLNILLSVTIKGIPIPGGVDHKPHYTYKLVVWVVNNSSESVRIITFTWPPVARRCKKIALVCRNLYHKQQLKAHNKATGTTCTWNGNIGENVTRNTAQLDLTSVSIFGREFFHFQERDRKTCLQCCPTYPPEWDFMLTILQQGGFSNSHGSNPYAGWIALEMF